MAQHRQKLILTAVGGFSFGTRFLLARQQFAPLHFSPPSIGDIRHHRQCALIFALVAEDGIGGKIREKISAIFTPETKFVPL